MKTNEVFISGGFPVNTYNPRPELKLEDKLVDYLETGHKLISITGPTKCGKTVLSTRVIPEESCVFVDGGAIRTEIEFWEFVAMDLQIDVETVTTQTKSKSAEKSGEISGEIGKIFVKLGSKVADKDVQTDTQSSSTTKVTLLKSIVLKTLVERNVVLLIDDFHYMNPDLQQSIVRAIKQPIFKGLKAVILAVPHRAFDSVKVESEMTGRVSQLSIPLWEINELEEIANLGFKKLNVSCEPTIITHLANESYGSPHLMQEFCSRICKINGIEESKEEVQTIKKPNYKEFFNQVVNTITSKIAFERLAAGPKIKGQERIQRKLGSGETADIYVVILHAIAETGPKTVITYDELRNSVKKVLADDMPSGGQISRVLSEMDKIAKSLPGQPVIDWGKDEDPKLYIADPFFAFYLKWSLKVN
ncbi:hypothetical protein ACFSJW_01580 [Flavobacterium artemisiae]|uniref:ATP-binding protein n=1 Tax=Flavobacterium artemisiae TaxID=2126556 RepID=A0ABW4HI67_9FLAO